jgi:hypothetical protein
VGADAGAIAETAGEANKAKAAAASAAMKADFMRCFLQATDLIAIRVARAVAATLILQTGPVETMRSSRDDPGSA